MGVIFPLSSAVEATYHRMIKYNNRSSNQRWIQLCCQKTPTFNKILPVVWKKVCLGSGPSVSLGQKHSTV